MEDKKTYDKYSLGWLRDQAKNDGFDNIPDWQKWKREQQKWKREQQWYKELTNIYGKEFADWARQNNDIPKKYLDLGCKTEREYRDKLAQKLGFTDRIEHCDYKARINGYKDDAERVRISRHDRGVCFPIYDNEDYPQYLGSHLAERKYATKILPLILGKIKKEMPINYPGYDFIVEKDMEIITVDVKSRRLSTKYKHWNFSIEHNSNADYFLLLAFNEGRREEELKLLHILLIRSDEKVRKCNGNGYYMERLFNRDGIAISNSPDSVMYFGHFKQYDHIDDPKIKECINKIESKDNDKISKARSDN